MSHCLSERVSFSDGYFVVYIGVVPKDQAEAASPLVTEQELMDLSLARVRETIKEFVARDLTVASLDSDGSPISCSKFVLIEDIFYAVEIVFITDVASDPSPVMIETTKAMLRVSVSGTFSDLDRCSPISRLSGTASASNGYAGRHPSSILWRPLQQLWSKTRGN